MTSNKTLILLGLEDDIRTSTPYNSKKLIILLVWVKGTSIENGSKAEN